VGSSPALKSTARSERSATSAPVSVLFLILPRVIVRFFSFFPATLLFWMFLPLIVSAAYELPPSATNSAR
jgi:hypothetical protein